MKQLHQSKKDFNHLKKGKNLMDYMNVFCAHAVLQVVPHFGGIQISLLDQLLFFKPIGF